MIAFKKTIVVKNRQISINLPQEFDAQEVEVIVFSKNEHALPDDFELSDEQKTILDERLKEPDENYISGEESIKRLRKKYGL